VSRRRSQIGVGGAQSVFAAQATQRPFGPQIFAAGVVQSAFVRHCTHVEIVVLHLGAVAAHCESAVQPARQVKSSGLQIGAAAPQSALDVHCTHR
jgi:hypothetical protein